VNLFDPGLKDSGSRDKAKLDPDSHPPSRADILSETLYLANVYPWATCGDLDEASWRALHAAASDVISRSYTAQAAISTVRSEDGAGEQPSVGQAGSRSLSKTRGTMFTFQLYVYRHTTTSDGLAVRKDEGPHKRSIFWVPERQVVGKVITP